MSTIYRRTFPRTPQTQHYHPFSEKEGGEFEVFVGFGSPPRSFAMSGCAFALMATPPTLGA